MIIMHWAGQTWTWTMAQAGRYWWVVLTLALVAALVAARQARRAPGPPAAGWRDDPDVPRFGADDPGL